MLARIKRSLRGGSIVHTAPELARIMTESHKTYMSAKSELGKLLTKQQAEIDDAHKYIASLKSIDPLQTTTG